MLACQWGVLDCLSCHLVVDHTFVALLVMLFLVPVFFNCYSIDVASEMVLNILDQMVACYIATPRFSWYLVPCQSVCIVINSLLHEFVHFDIHPGLPSQHCHYAIILMASDMFEVELHPQFTFIVRIAPMIS